MLKTVTENDTKAWDKAWSDVQSLRPIIEAAREECDSLRRLPDSIANAFLERDVYRLILPVELGGAGLDPLQHHKLTMEVSRFDASVGWNFAIAPLSAVLATDLDADDARKLFATPDCGAAISGAPQGRAVACEGGYRVTGQFGWASGIHQARRVGGGCFVFDGEEMRKTPEGGPVIMQVFLPKEEVEILDTWHVGGMRGTGSTEFVINDIFVPHEQTFVMYSGKSKHDDPFFKLPRSYFGYGLSAVPLGAAMTTIEALKGLALEKKGRVQSKLAEQGSVQYAIGKGLTMIESATLAVHDAFSRLWDEIREDGVAQIPTRARVRRSMFHAVESGIEVVTMCYREAGGSALFESAPFERALRDVNAIGGHVVFQKTMMEDLGRVELGFDPRLPNF